MMDKLIEKFPNQLLEALEIGSLAKISQHHRDIKNIYVAGLGGSGIGGDFVKEIIRDKSAIPLVVGKSYTIPNFINSESLAIVSSYSGNTEETLSALQYLKQTGAKIVCISSGGKLLEDARMNSLDYIKVPDNWASPRACLGYSIVIQLLVLEKFSIISSEIISRIRASVDLIKFNNESMKKEAFNIAKKFVGKTPIIYSTDRMESVAVRLRQQLNENAKMLCWHHVLPEMNHNELVGWKDRREDLVVLFLRNRDDSKKNEKRMEITKTIIANYTSTIVESYSRGKTLVEKVLYFVHLGDWLSWFVADMRNVDSIEVEVIDYLKQQLHD